MKTYTLTTTANRIMPHPQAHELKPEKILTNDVCFPWEGHPSRPKLWLIGNEFGAIAALWAGCEQDALDALCDQGLSGGLSATDEPERPEVSNHDDEHDLWEARITRLGNAGEPHNLDDLWMATVNLEEATPELLCKLAEARGANVDNLSEI